MGWTYVNVSPESAAPRIPCRTFAWALDEPGWVKRFSDHGRSGAYCQVITPGRVSVGDDIVVEFVPDTHDVSVVDLFRAYLGDKE